MREILHLTIPCFPIAVARVVHSELRQRPVAVAATHSGRALIQAVSAEARQEGVWCGMTVDRALQRCPGLHLLLPEPQLWQRANRALQSLTAELAPLWEPVAAGRLFLDVSGCKRLLGPGRDIALRLERQLQERLRLHGSVGVAGNKLVARIAAGYLNQPGICDILPGREASFLGPLPVATLPGIGRHRQQQLLEELNLQRIAELARLQLTQLALLYGNFAPLLYQRARGIDHAPVRLPQKKPELHASSLLTESTNQSLPLRAELGRLVEECGFALRKKDQRSGRIRLQLGYADGATENRQSLLAPALNSDDQLLLAADQLLEGCLQRRLQVRSLHLRCDLLQHSLQAPLFAPPRQRCDTLQDTLDQLRGRYGVQVIHRGRSLGRHRAIDG